MTPSLQTYRRAPGGSALILVLWCLLLLGMAVFSVIQMVELSVEHTTHLEHVQDARALASSGIALGLNSQLLKDDPLLNQTNSVGGVFRVTIGSEGARLNINHVLANNHRQILVNLFQQWGLRPVDADHAADCLYDWVTPGSLKSLNGAKADDYARAGLPQTPSGEPFVSLDEVASVMGMDAVEKAHPTWRDSFTLWSSGPLDVNEAPPELIAAVFGLDPSRVTFMTDARNGKDGIVGTSDDVPVPDTKTFQAELGLDDTTMKAYGGEIALKDTVRRVESVGQVEGTQVMISVVTPLKASPIQYFLWSEQ